MSPLMKPNLKFGGPQQRQLLLILSLGLIGAWAYGRIALFPQLRQLSSIGQQIQTSRQELRTLQQVVANEQRVREQHEQVEKTVTSLRSLLPSERDLSSVIEYLSNLAVKAHLKIETISPQLAEEPGPGLPDKRSEDHTVYRVIPIQIDARAGYHEIGTFLNLVETGSIPIEVGSLRIVEDEQEFRRHQMTLVLHAFFAVEQQKTSRLGELPAEPAG